MKTNQMIHSSIYKTMVIVSVALLLSACGQSSNKSTNEDKKIAKLTDIHTAAFMGNVNAINDHIKAGSDLNIKDQYGSTPLVIAITFDRKDVAKALIIGGADLEIKSKDGSTPLHTASFFCRTEIVGLLLENGADKTMTNNYGVTPFESVLGPFDQVKPIYEQLNKDLGPLGLKLDYDRIEKTRPVIAEMLK